MIVLFSYLNNKVIIVLSVNGTTGEGPALTLEERTKVVEKWMEAKRSRYRDLLF